MYYRKSPKERPRTVFENAASTRLPMISVDLSDVHAIELDPISYHSPPVSELTHLTILPIYFAISSGEDNNEVSSKVSDKIGYVNYSSMFFSRVLDIDHEPLELPADTLKIDRISHSGYRLTLNITAIVKLICLRGKSNRVFYLEFFSMDPRFCEIIRRRMSFWKPVEFPLKLIEGRAPRDQQSPAPDILEPESKPKQKYKIDSDISLTYNKRVKTKVSTPGSYLEER